MTDATAPGPPAGELRALDRSLLRGIAWTGAAKWSVQLLSWASTLIVARLLTPGDFGVFGMATVYYGFAQLVNEFGLGAAIVQRRDLDPPMVARLGGVAIIVGVLLFLVSSAIAFPFAAFFGEPVVRWLVIGLSTTFIISSVQVVPYALMSRDLQFRRLAVIDLAEAFTLTSTTLLLAVLHFRYWALMAGMIASKAVAAGLTMIIRRARVAWPGRLATLKSAVTFGWQVVVGRVTWYTYSNADFAIVGRVLGKAALGAYSFGWQIASIPVDKIGAVISRVTMPVFAAVQDDKPAIGRYLKQLTEGLALITFPASAGAFLVADDFVLLALGERWRAAIVPLRLLALYASVRSIMTLFPQILVAMGDARRTMHMGLLAVVVLPTLFYFGTRWGTTGVALAWIIGYPLLSVPLLMLYTLRRIRLPLGEYLGSMWPAASATLAMAVVVVALRAVMPARWHLAPRFCIEVLAGAATYAAVVLGAHGDRVRAFRSALRAQRRPPAGS